MAHVGVMYSIQVHYTRVHEEEWDRVFKLAVEMGLNCIQTCVRTHTPICWHLHARSYV